MYARAPGCPACKYGLGCYRRNAEHWAEYDHPADHPMLKESGGKRAHCGSTGEGGPPKLPRQAGEPSAPPTAAAAGPSKPSLAATPTPSGGKPAVIIFAPGAGGSTAVAMKALHADLRKRGMVVVDCGEQPLKGDESRWVTQSPASKRNIAHLVAVANRAAEAHSGLPILLCGASFGCRVLAETLRTHRCDLPSCVVDALICCGFPLHKPEKPEDFDPKRKQHLLQLPASITTLFVQGETDEFLGPRGMEALREVTAQMAGPTSLEVVPGGTHTVPNAKGLKKLNLTQAQVTARVLEAIVTFVNERC